MNLPNPWLEIK